MLNLERLIGVKPEINYLPPVLSKKLRFGKPAYELLVVSLGMFFAAEIRIRGIDAKSASSITVLLTLRLN